MKINKLIKTLFLTYVCCFVSVSYAFRNVAYVETNTNALSNVSCFVQSDTKKPFFDTAVIFAANIHGTDPNKPTIYLNPQDSKLLNDTKQISSLQKKGIKVLVTLLGDHQNSG